MDVLEATESQEGRGCIYAKQSSYVKATGFRDPGEPHGLVKHANFVFPFIAARLKKWTILLNQITKALKCLSEAKHPGARTLRFSCPDSHELSHAHGACLLMDLLSPRKTQQDRPGIRLLGKYLHRQVQLTKQVIRGLAHTRQTDPNQICIPLFFLPVDTLTEKIEICVKLQKRALCEPGCGVWNGRQRRQLTRG